jgi:glutaminyl-tRNA synthetase
VAAEFGGRTHLRFDDTNPIKEEQEYIDAIEADVRWLGFDWAEHLYFASDYFEQLYDWAVDLIKAGKAFVDDSSADQIREDRGTLTEPWPATPLARPVNRRQPRPVRAYARRRISQRGTRPARQDRHGVAQHQPARPGACTASSMPAIRARATPGTSTQPYDFAHGQSDAIEGITHSLCTLEFEIHRPLYDWLIDNLPVPSKPRQIEFARLNLTYTVLSKRFLMRLVAEGHVHGWDDPRMPTISGLRRRGFPAEGIRDFAESVGVSKADSVVEIGQLEHAVRDVLNRTAPRRFAVLDPLKVVIDNYPEGQVEEFEVPNNPEDPGEGNRRVPFTREIWIEREDFMEQPPPKFFRLSPGSEVRLRGAYFITCNEVVKDALGTVVELRCTYDPDSRGGAAPDGRRPKATLHWLSTKHALPAEVRLYDHLFSRPEPGAAGDLMADLNLNSETILKGAFVEASLADAQPGTTYQFERLGYFAPDPDSAPGLPVFNRTLVLRDTWARVQAQSATG